MPTPSDPPPYDQFSLLVVAAVRLASCGFVALYIIIGSTPHTVIFWPVFAVASAYALGMLWASIGRLWQRLPIAIAGADVGFVVVLMAASGGAESPLRRVLYVAALISGIVFTWKGVLTLAAGELAALAVASFPSAFHSGISTSTVAARYTEDALNIGLLTLAAALLSIAFRRRARAVEDLSAGRQQLLGEVLETEARERRRLAQILHDDALQTLLAAAQDMDEAAEGDPESLARARRHLDSGVRQVRDVVRGFHPVALDHGGLEVALRAIGDRAATRGGLEVEVDVDPLAQSRHDALLALLAREMSVNAIKHAQARRLRISARRDGDSVQLEVADDGIGIPAGRQAVAVREGHIGLASSAERVSAAGGRLVVESPAAGGTRVLVALPDAAPVH